MTDLHALIHRMADELDHYRQLLTDDRRGLHPLATEARSALAEPESASLEQGVQQMQPFVVRHYTEDERPTIKGNGFDANYSCARRQAVTLIRLNRPLRPVDHPTAAMNETIPTPASDRDPWKHRSEGMRCKSCIWFAPKERVDGITDIGRCRRHAPTMNGYPVVFVNDWCGDHKLNENWLP